MDEVENVGQAAPPAGEPALEDAARVEETAAAEAAAGESAPAEEGAVVGQAVPSAGEPVLEEGARVEEAAPAEPADVSAAEAAPAEETAVAVDYAALKPMIEAIVYLAEEPVTAAQVAAVIEQSSDVTERLLAELIAEYAAPGRGLMIREVAGGYKMGTKPEHHDVIRKFVKSLKPPLKLSLAALETLATIAYKQPITAPEIMAIRGVQGAGVLKTLLDRKLIVAAGRKNVVGRPVLYKTSKEFLVQFGLKDLSELPTLKEFEELRRLSAADEEPAAEAAPGRETLPGAHGAEPAENGAESGAGAAAASEAQDAAAESGAGAVQEPGAQAGAEIETDPPGVPGTREMSEQGGAAQADAASEPETAPESENA
jgi:segregation and condensation protein B